MIKYLLKIQYKGTKYNGWQYQPGIKTIQGILEEKLAILLKNNIRLFVAGRTDAGVHARMQFAHFESEKELIEYKFLYSINSLLKEEEILITSLSVVNSEFHARFSCKSKTYKYYLLVGRFKNLFKQGTYWLIPKFDIDHAQKCANYLIGQHDFSSFQDAQCQAKSPIKTINECTFKQNEDLIEFSIKAQSFLHHQIRITIGTIYEIVARNQSSETMKIILENKNRQTAGPTAPACALFLEEIVY